MPTHSDVSSHRDSWPPTQVRLVRSASNKSYDEPRPLLDDIDEDPLIYFLTPSADENAMDLDSDDGDDVVMDFDAGIEIPGRPREVIRSVSPSTLDGLRRLRATPRRTASPDFDSEVFTSDEDDDDNEDYVRLSPSPSPPPPSARSIHHRSHSPNSLLSAAAIPRHHSFNGFGFRARSPVFGRSSDGFLPPTASFPAPSPPTYAITASPTLFSTSPRGRSAFASRCGRLPPGTYTSNSNASARVSRPGHLWREPSADVWSIEEETEEELLMSEILGSIGVRSDGGAARPTAGGGLRSSKLLKKVRFVLPGER